MTNWQKMSNFFLDIGLERPDAVVVDRASQQLRDLYSLADHGSADSFKSFAEGLSIPEYHNDGVLTYDQSSEEAVFFQSFEETVLEQEDQEAVEELIPDNLDTREIRINVDAYNDFDVEVPSNDYIDNVDFSEYERILERYRDSAKD